MVFEVANSLLNESVCFVNAELLIAYLKRVLGKLVCLVCEALVDKTTVGKCGTSQPIPCFQTAARFFRSEGGSPTNVIGFWNGSQRFYTINWIIFPFYISFTAKIVRQVDTLHILSCCGIVARSLQVQKFRGDLGGVFEVARIDARPIGR